MRKIIFELNKLVLELETCAELVAGIKKIIDKYSKQKYYVREFVFGNPNYKDKEVDVIEEDNEKVVYKDAKKIKEEIL